MSKIAVQTYTIRKDLKTKASVRIALTKLKNSGINTIELARIKFHRNEVLYIKEICEELHIDICSTQIKPEYIKSNLDWIIELHKILDCKNVVISVIPLKILNNKDKLIEFAKEMTEVGKILKENDLNLLHHHHHFEFLKINGELIFDILLKNSDPEYLGLVIDTYWVQRGGKDPSDFILKNKERVKGVHLRDYKNKFSLINGDFTATDTEIGNGNLDFKKIIDTCIKLNISYMAIEQATKKPYISIECSVKHLKGLGFGSSF